MRALRWLVAGLLWVLAGLLGLVGVVLSVTVILLPLGIPVLMLARRLFALSGRLVLPRSVRHPVEETGKALKRRGGHLEKATKVAGKDARRNGAKATKKARKRVRRLPVGRRRRTWLGVRKP